MKPRTGAVLAAIAVLAVLSITIPIAAFVFQFWDSPISTDPTDWSSFGEYVGGIAGPLLGVINLCVVVYIAMAVYRLETQRERELVRPFAHVDTGDYENDIYVKIQNLGLGPMVITKCECYSIKRPEDRKADLVDLMPDLDVSWTTFTIGGPSKVIPHGGEAVLIQLTGDDEQGGFSESRAEVRRHLRDIVVEVHYEDMFRNPMELAGGICSAFARHDG